MNREEAARVLTELADEYEKYEISAYGWLRTTYIPAHRMAAAALRDMLKRREGCDFCNESEQIQNQYGDIMGMDDGVLILDTEGYPGVTFRIKYCPMCGRKLEEEG